MPGISTHCIKLRRAGGSSRANRFLTKPSRGPIAGSRAASRLASKSVIAAGCRCAAPPLPGVSTNSFAHMMYDVCSSLHMPHCKQCGCVHVHINVSTRTCEHLRLHMSVQGVCVSLSLSLSVGCICMSVGLEGGKDVVLYDRCMAM